MNVRLSLIGRTLPFEKQIDWHETQCFDRPSGKSIPSI